MSDGKVLIDTEMDDSGVDKGISGLQKKMAGVGKGMQQVGKKMTKGLTLPIIAAGTGALLMAANFDDSMRNVKATMGDNLGSSTKEANANFKALREEALRLGATTAHSASDASAGMKELAQMGYDTNMILGNTANILDVASASGEGLDFVASTLAGTMNQFGIEADESGKNMQRVGDVMIRAGQISGTSFGEIAKALEYTGSSADAAGMSIEQTAAYIGVLGDNNIKGSKAGTAMNAMLRDMKDKVNGNVLEFEGFNVAMYDGNGNMRDMTDIMMDVEAGLEGKTDAERDAAIASIFGSQAQQAVNAILKSGTGVLTEYEQKLKMSSDAAKIAAGEMEGGMGGAMRALKSATEGLAIAFGDILIPVVQAIAKFVANLFLKFIELSDGQKKAIVVVLAVIAAIGPLLTILGTLLVVIPAVVGAIAAVAGPVAIAIAIIAALVAIGVKLYQNWDTVKEKAIAVFGNFAPLLEPFKAAFESLKASVEPIISSLKALWESLKPVFGAVAVIIGGVVVTAFGVLTGILTGVARALEPLINAFINFVDFVSEGVNLIVALFMGDFSAAWEHMSNMGGSVIEFLVNGLKGLLEFVSGFVEGVVNFFKGMYMTIVGGSIVPDMVNEIVDWFKNMFKWLVDLVKNIVEGVKSGFNTMKEAIKSIMDSIKATISNIWDGIKSVVTTVINAIKSVITSIWNGIKNFISSVMNGIKIVFSTVWNAIKTVVTSVVNSVRSTVTNVFNSIRSSISSIMNGIKSVMSSVWNGIKSTISSVVNSIKNTVSNIFNSLKGIVTSAMSGVKSAVTTGINGAYKAVTNKVKDFYNAGRNIITSIADGIKSAVGKVTGAISGVVSKIRGFLPFSPAKEGPLQDINKLNFGGPIEDSLDAAIPDVQAKLNTLLRVPNINYDGRKTPSSKVPAGAPGKSGILITGNEFVIRKDSDIRGVARELENMRIKKERGR